MVSSLRSPCAFSVFIAAVHGDTNTARRPSFLREDLQVDFEAELPENGRWLSTKPPVLEVENWLSPELCKRIIQEAKQEGIKESITAKGNMLEKMKMNPRFHGYLSQLDEDRSGCLNRSELKAAIVEVGGVFADKALLDKLQHTLSACPSISSFMMSAEVPEAVQSAVKKRPWLRTRFSKQAWLDAKLKLPQLLTKKLSGLLGFDVTPHAEDLQVVNYPALGHYSCHHDSGTRLSVEGRSHGNEVRAITAMFYLNDVISGGETSFPYAGSDVKIKDATSGCGGRVIMRTLNKCNATGLVVKPSRGKLLLFFNAAVRGATDAVAKSQTYQLINVFANSYHSGCRVAKGSEKWVAQQWITFKPVNLSSPFYHDMAKAGDAVAQMFLGEGYLRGVNDLPLDKSQARKWLRRAAGLGMGRAKELLASLPQSKRQLEL